MTSKSDAIIGQHNWFRWLPRSFLLSSIILALAPFLIAHYEMHWHFNLFYSLIDIMLMNLLLVIIVVIVAWLRPVSGGAVALLASLLLLIEKLPVWIIQGYSVEIIFSGYLFLFIECLLLFTGGILSIIWGQLGQSRERKIFCGSAAGYTRHSWFRWLSIGFLFAAAVLPLFYELAIRRLNLPAPILFIIALIAWPAPIIGGSVAIITILYWIILLLSRAGTMLPPFFNLFIYCVCISLLVGGILSIIWGILWRRWRGNKQKEYGWL